MNDRNQTALAKLGAGQLAVPVLPCLLRCSLVLLALWWRCEGASDGPDPNASSSRPAASESAHRSTSGRNAAKRGMPSARTW